MEDFLPDSDTSTLSCRHAFHPNCLKNWLSIILLYPKCPNCNNKILDYEIEESGESNFEGSINSVSNNLGNENNRIIENINQSQVNVQQNNSRLLNDRSVNAQRNDALNSNSPNDPRSNNVRLGASVRSANVRRNPLDEDFSMLSNININTNEHINTLNRNSGHNLNDHLNEDVPTHNEVRLDRDNFVLPSRKSEDNRNEENENTQIKNNENINSNANANEIN